MALPDMTRKPPLLVTGVPRSGTTWLARSLASSPGTAMPGREPMNPRGRQLALGGTVQGWVRLDSLDRRQARILRRIYRGMEPRALSRYGIRQYAALTPWTRIIVKDPFALLSLPAVVAATGAEPVLLYRHPAAVLVSYRRMGWTADIDEIAALGAHLPDRRDEVTDMAAFWSYCNTSALDGLSQLGGGTVVSHEDLVRGGPLALAALMHHLGLDGSVLANAPTSEHVRREGLHDFRRSPEDVLGGWRALLSDREIAELEARTEPTSRRLAARRLRLPDAAALPSAGSEIS